MTDTPDPAVTITDLKVENATLRGSLFIAARRLKDFLDAPAREVGQDRLRLTIPRSLRESAAEALAEIPTITVARVMDDARAVGADHKAKNKPRYLAGRLARGFGLALPDCPGVKRFTREQLDQGWGNIQRLRAERAGKAFEQRFHDGREPTAAEYARTEDE